MLALSIRRDRTPVVLRKLAKAESDARVARRILAIANALDGMSREEAAQSAGMDRQTLRDWVIRYNADGIDGLADRPRDGRPPKLDAEEKAELVRIVLAGPDPEVSGLSAFTREDLVRICKQRFTKSLHVTSMGRILRELELTRQKARPSNPEKDPAAQAAFKKRPGAAQKNSVRIKTSVSACSSRTRHGSARRAGPAISGGSAASVHRASATSASRSPTSLLVWSLAPTTASPSSCPTPTPRRCSSSSTTLLQRLARMNTRSWSSTRPVGTTRVPSVCRPTSRSCRCRLIARAQSRRAHLALPQGALPLPPMSTRQSSMRPARRGSASLQRPAASNRSAPTRGFQRSRLRIDGMNPCNRRVIDLRC